MHPAAVCVLQSAAPLQLLPVFTEPQMKRLSRVFFSAADAQPRLDGDAEALLVVRQHTAEEVAHAGLQGDSGEFGGGVVVVDLQPEADFGEGEAVVEL